MYVIDLVVLHEDKYAYSPAVAIILVMSAPQTSPNNNNNQSCIYVNQDAFRYFVLK